jgi:23S rRNA pseudouridine1911/1915/1917 synthase
MRDVVFISPNTKFTYEVLPEVVGQRIDVFLASRFPAYSRTYFQKLIKTSAVKANGVIIKSSYLLELGDIVEVVFPPAPDKKEIKNLIDDLGAKIIGEHPHFFIVYKPIGVSMHAGHRHDTSATLVDWLLEQFADLQDVGHEERPGIVHRLDKYTSGIVIIPRNNYAHKVFSDKFRNREIEKTYIALTKGVPPAQGCIDFSIGHHPSHKKMMALAKGSPLGREAFTEYRVVQAFNNAALVEVKPKTGRTHQIRVHFAALGFPLIGDVIYGEPSDIILHQALHAYKLSFEYDGQRYVFEHNPPDDFIRAKDVLKKTATSS